MRRKQILSFAIAVLLMIALIFNCTSSKVPYKVVQPKRDSVVKILGQAQNSILGACVTTKNGPTYWIEDKKEWEDTLLSKNVEVKGVYYIKYWKRIRKKDEGIVSRMQGQQRIIKNAIITKSQ